MDKFNKNPKIAIIGLAVAHKEFESLNVREFIGKGIIHDVKGVLPKDRVEARL